MANYPIYVRKRHPDARKPQLEHTPTAPAYGLATVKEAIEVAIESGRYDTAQQLMEASGYELCVLCVTVAPMLDAIEMPTGDWITACESCAMEHQAV